jgi:2-C-methyl-D-erythritol 2,4-cyclodiphosphate synthase
MAEQRVGLGFDVHRWDASRPLRLGTLLVDGERGLGGHSDGDVVAHAIADAMLGAAALGDLGEHLSDRDPTIAGISGEGVLARVLALVRERGYAVASLDATVVAERPAIAPLREAMRSRLASALDARVDAVSVKATRPEGLGLVGDGIGCLAVVTLERA